MFVSKYCLSNIAFECQNSIFICVCIYDLACIIIMIITGSIRRGGGEIAFFHCYSIC